MHRPRWSIRRARTLIGTKFLLIAGLVGFVLLAWLTELAVGVHEAVHLGPLLAAAMAGVPAVLWLGFFYLMDRHEPEPKQLVAGVFVLGALIAAPIADFVQSQAVPPVALAVHGLSPFSLDRVLDAVLIAGLSQEMCKYAVVRYTIYMSREFDEPMDGIVYMMACGTGFAVWVNYHRLSGQNHEVYLSIGAAQAVVTTLAHASFAGVLGYAMGRAKFSRRSAPVRGILLMVGLLAAAALNGQFTIVEDWVLQHGLSQHPWYGVGYAALCAATMFAIIWLGSQRLLAASPFRRPGGRASSRADE
jgi:RsiW-degrading membrane proteinase PrsW (M82 family)